MKKIKIILIIIGSTAATAQLLSMGIKIEKTPSATITNHHGISNWSFEFKNEENHSVTVSVINNNQKILSNYQVGPQGTRGYVRTTGLNLNRPTLIIIKDSLNKMPRAYKTSGDNKTIYVSWKNNKLEPQIGHRRIVLKGRSPNYSITDSKLDLEKNINTDDLKEIEYKPDLLNATR